MIARVVRALQRIAGQAPDPVAFWSARAACPGTTSVLWGNEAYNAEAERDQWAAIERHLPARRGAVLDLGCGTGRLAPRLAGTFSEYVGVDLPPMIEEARRRAPALSAGFVASTVQAYEVPPARFDLILSLACLASACTADELPAVLDRLARGLGPGGRLLLIDPFHRRAPLARTCRLSAADVVRLARASGLQLREWSGVHFLPWRPALASARLASAPGLTRALYRAGEALGRLAPRRLFDYAVLAFEAPCTSA